MNRPGAWVMLAGLCLSSCSLPDDMHRSPAFSPYEHPRTPPTGVLAIGDPPILSRQAASNTLTNPRPATPQVLEEGAHLYRVYCAVCHGPDGTGEGTVAEYFRRMPDLTVPYVRRYPDGRLYTVIRQGGFEMPAYADALSADERWALVHHVRTLGDAP